MRVVDGRREAFAVRHFAEPLLPCRVSRLDDGHGRPQYDKMLRCRLDPSKPLLDVLAIDVVLYDCRKPGSGVPISNGGRQLVAKVQQPARLRLVRVADMYPPRYGPPIELAAANVHTPPELTRQQIGHRGLSRRLRARHEPNATHDDSLRELDTKG